MDDESAGRFYVWQESLWRDEPSDDPNQLFPAPFGGHSYTQGFRRVHAGLRSHLAYNGKTFCDVLAQPGVVGDEWHGNWPKLQDLCPICIAAAPAQFEGLGPSYSMTRADEAQL